MSIDLTNPNVAAILERLDSVLARVDSLLAERRPVDDAATLDAAVAFIWQRRGEVGSFHPIRHYDVIRLEDLIGIDGELKRLTRNTEQFLQGAPANHVLLWGDRGTGKSSAIKALLPRYAERGLRLVQVYRQDLRDLPEITDRLWDRPEKYILFCDDLSFEADDAEYKELKAMPEGGLHARPLNMLIYATSNRRHLIPEHLADRQVGGGSDEAFPRDALEEQISLADRFGMRLGFYRIDQDTYLDIVRHLVEARGLTVDPRILERDALRWALSYNGRSGRSARQFVDDLEGRQLWERHEQ